MKFKVIFINAALAFFFTVTTSKTLVAQSWVIKANIPNALADAASCVLNNKIYIVGGSNNNGALNSLYVYDPATNTWTAKTGMTFARGLLGLATVNGKLYAIGGYNNGAVNIVEEYDPITDTWSTKAPMSQNKCEISVGVINNKIYVVGGNPGFFNPNFNSALVEEYTPNTNTWLITAPIPQGRTSARSIQVIGNTLYYIAGKDLLPNVALNTCYKYTPITNTWLPIANIPQPTCNGATSVIGSNIHYFGGANGNNSLKYNYHFVYFHHKYNMNFLGRLIK